MDQDKILGAKLFEIFLIMVMTLNLQASGGRIRLGSRRVSYGFTTSQALQALGNMAMKVTTTNISTTLSYKINADVGRELLARCFDAHLVYCPGDRTLATVPSDSSMMQPTAKGVAVVARFVAKLGVAPEKWPLIITLNYNSLALISFQRNPIDDTILLSPKLIQLIFSWMMGPQPNVWDPFNPPDPISIQLAHGNYPGLPQERLHLMPQSTSSSSNSKAEVLPYHHRYYTNPELDLLSQYYSSAAGLRLIKHVGKVIRCFSGKGICQWLMDCTDLDSPRQAVVIASHMMNMGLIQAVLESPLRLAEGQFTPHRSCYYSVSERGLAALRWAQPPLNPFADSIKGNPSDGWIKAYFADASLDLLLGQVLEDPGLAQLLQQYLDLEFAGENLEAYTKLWWFESRIDKLVRLVQRLMIEPKAVASAITECKLTAFQIFVCHISDDLPYPVNIELKLKARVARLFADPAHFDAEEVGEFIHTPQELTFEAADQSRPPLYLEESVTEEVFGPINENRCASSLSELAYLARLAMAYRGVMNHLYRVMETDNFPRFVQLFSI